MTAIAANGSVTCTSVASDPQTIAPGVIQVNSSEIERVLIDANGMQVVGKCAVGSADIALRVLSAGLNIVSDSRNVHRGQTHSSGDLAVGTANPGVILDRGEFNAFVYAWYGLDVLITVVALPISMRLCDPRVAATQFTLYMATANFGISVAAWVLGFSRQLSGLPMMFVVVFALHLVGLMLVVLVKFPRWTAVEDEVAAQLAVGEGPEPVIN
jgi:hypothetical protein